MEFMVIDYVETIIRKQNLQNIANLEKKVMINLIIDITKFLLCLLLNDL